MSDPVEELSRLVSILCDGWYERIEYGVIVDGEVEVRVERIKHAPLLVQLRTMTQSLIRAKQEGGSGAKPGSKPPGAFAAAAVLDEIQHWAHSAVEDWSNAPGRHLRRTVARELHILLGCSQLQSDEAVCTATAHLRRFVQRARLVIGHEAPTRAFADTYCGGCGGELRAPIDAAGPVFCAGRPGTAPCGIKYRPEDVIRLAVAMAADMEEADGSTQAGGHGASSDLLGDAAQAG